MTKRELRAAIKARIVPMSRGRREESARKIAEKLAAFGWKGKRIMLYRALGDELDVAPAAVTLAADNEVFYPAVDGEDMFAVADSEDTETGAFGIAQPVGERLNAADARLDICVVPLRAFDASCARLGRGKGYYDRFLRGEDCFKVGVAYDEQQTDGLPTEPHDVPLDIVVTPTEIYRR